MPPASANARVPDAPSLLQAYVACATARGRANKSFLQGARAFLARWPEPQEWADEPLEVRLAAGSSQWPLLNFLMFWGHLQPGYDYLVERKLSALWREMPLGPWGAELRRYQAAAQALGYGPRTCAGTASQIAARLLIQTGRPLIELTEQDFAEFEQAIAERERRHGRSFKHYRNALYAARTVIYHLGSGAEPLAKALHPVAMELGAPSGGCARIAARFVRALPGVLRRHSQAVDRLAYGLAVGALRPSAGQARSGPHFVGRVGPSAAHRAIPA